MSLRRTLILFTLPPACDCLLAIPRPGTLAEHGESLNLTISKCAQSGSPTWIQYQCTASEVCVHNRLNTYLYACTHTYGCSPQIASSYYTNMLKQTYTHAPTHPLISLFINTEMTFTNTALSCHFPIPISLSFRLKSCWANPHKWMHLRSTSYNLQNLLQRHHISPMAAAIPESRTPVMGFVNMSAYM
jgi:hypothetical protein